MLKIKRYDVHLSAMPIVIAGMRNSWDSWEKSDSYEYINPLFENLPGHLISEIPKCFCLGAADKKRALNLIQTGDDHGKFMRQISIVAEITAPELWWIQFDQYKIGTCTNSTSTMHTLGKYEIECELFSLEDVDDDDREVYLNLLRKLRAKWILKGKKRGSKEWRAMCQLAPRGLLYTRTLSANYQVLRHMYHSRRNHKLDEWSMLRDWIETLPYSEFITIERERT